jgi:RNA recognition motif-containing protein
MKNKLYVGNLDPKVTKKQLIELFSQVGKVKKTNIVTDKETGDPKGFGFVEMNNQKEAEKAVEKFDGHELEGKAIKVAVSGSND